LDGSPISQKQRDDYELFYLSHIAQEASKEPGQLAREHPRWEQLRSKHGQMEINKNDRIPSRLRDHMIKLNVYSASERSTFELSDCITIPVLPHMTLRALRARISKTLKGRAAGTKIMLWQRMQDGVLSELDAGHDSKDLSWHGLEEGTTIAYTLKE